MIFSTTEKENFLGVQTSPLPEHEFVGVGDAGRGVLVESSPTRSLVIPSAQLTRIESPNKPSTTNRPATKPREQPKPSAAKENRHKENVRDGQWEKGQESREKAGSDVGGVWEIRDPVFSKDVLEFMNAHDDEDAGARRMSRARKPVNYALPNLRDKMRRGDPDITRGRSQSLDRSVTPQPAPQPVPPPKDACSGIGF
jgi:Shugoshin C terminus